MGTRWRKLSDQQPRRPECDDGPFRFIRDCAALEPPSGWSDHEIADSDPSLTLSQAGGPQNIQSSGSHHRRPFVLLAGWLAGPVDKLSRRKYLGGQ